MKDSETYEYGSDYDKILLKKKQYFVSILKRCTVNNFNALTVKLVLSISCTLRSTVAREAVFFIFLQQIGLHNFFCSCHRERLKREKLTKESAISGKCPTPNCKGKVAKLIEYDTQGQAVSLVRF